MLILKVILKGLYMKVGSFWLYLHVHTSDPVHHSALWMFPVTKRQHISGYSAN